MHIYKITNLINNKIYVGKEKHNNPKYFGSGLLIKKAIEKHGIQNFEKTILEECDTFEQMSEREIYWIAELNATNLEIGYNLQSGGIGGCDSEFVKAKISDTVSKLWADPDSVYNTVEYRENLSEALKQVVWSEERLQKNAEFLKANPPWKGKKFSDEHKQNIGNSVRGEKNGLFGKYLPHMDANLIPFEKGSIPWNKGKTNVYSSETLERMSNSAKTKKIDPVREQERRRKLSERYKNTIPSWAIQILDTRDGMIYNTTKEFKNAHNLTFYKYKKLLNSNIIKQIKPNND